MARQFNPEYVHSLRTCMRNKYASWEEADRHTERILNESGPKRKVCLAEELEGFGEPVNTEEEIIKIAIAGIIQKEKEKEEKRKKQLELAKNKISSNPHPIPPPPPSPVSVQDNRSSKKSKRTYKIIVLAIICVIACYFEPDLTYSVSAAVIASVVVESVIEHILQ